MSYIGKAKTKEVGSVSKVILNRRVPLELKTYVTYLNLTFAKFCISHEYEHRREWTDEVDWDC